MRDALARSHRAYRDDEELRYFKTRIDLREFAKTVGYEATRDSGPQGYWRGRRGRGDEIIVKRKDDVWVFVDPRAVGRKHVDSTDKKPGAGDDLSSGQPLSTQYRSKDRGREGGLRSQGTIIDLLQRERRDLANLGEVRKELRRYAGSLPPCSAPPAPAQAPLTRAQIQADIRGARFDSSSFYLAQRGLRPETLRSFRFAWFFGVRPWGEVIFPHSDADGFTGYERKHFNRTLFSKGGTRTLWCSRALVGDKFLIVSETAIDCLSFHQLHPRPDARYLSTAGTPSSLQWDLLARAIAKMPPGGALIPATDSDEVGRRLAAALADVAAARNPSLRVEQPLPPVGKDWNDAVKDRERAFIHSITTARRPGR